MNNTVGPIFNEKVVEKWNLWAHKQYTIRKKSQKATGEKKKKKEVLKRTLKRSISNDYILHLIENRTINLSYKLW